MYFCKNCQEYPDRIFYETNIKVTYRVALRGGTLIVDRMYSDEISDKLVYCRRCGDNIGMYNREEALEHLLTMKKENIR